jgi:hypothetical protein
VPLCHAYGFMVYGLMMLIVLCGVRVELEVVFYELSDSSELSGAVSALVSRNENESLYASSRSPPRVPVQCGTLHRTCRLVHGLD